MKQKMYVTFGALLLGAMTVQAQSSVVAGGSDAKNAENASMGISIGQLAVETFTKSPGSLLLGIQQDFSVVESAVATNPIPDIKVPEGGEAECVSLEDYFVTESKLNYSATSTNDAVAKPVLDGMNLAFVLGKPGTATITVVATNEKGEKTTLSFTITVEGDEEPPIVYDNPKEAVVALYGDGSVLLAKVKNPMELTVPKYIAYVALQDAVKAAQSAIANNKTTDEEFAELAKQLQTAIDGFNEAMNPTAVGEIANDPTVSVVGRTIYISNMNGEPCTVYDIAGKCVYSCKDMMNAMITIRVVGVYVVKVGDKQQNVIVGN